MAKILIFGVISALLLTGINSVSLDIRDCGQFKVCFSICFELETKTILLFFFCFFFAGSKIGRFSNVSVSDCDMTKSSCVLHRNTNATIGVNFNLGMPLSNTNNSSKWKVDLCFIIIYLRHLVGVNEVDKVQSLVHGVILGIPIPFPLPNPDACKDSGLTCPLEKDKNYEYVTTLPVLSTYPKV